MISVWPKFYSFDPEMVLHFHFTFKPFPGHVQKRERARERERGRKKEERVEIVQSRARRYRSSTSPAPRRSREVLIAIARSFDSRDRADRDLTFTPIAIVRSVRIWWFFLGFVCVLRNEWYYIFVWQSRKCEQQVENVFSMVFFKNTTKHHKIFFETFFEMQLNTWKHFPFRKIAFPENRIFFGNTFTQTKRSLNCTLNIVSYIAYFSLSRKKKWNDFLYKEYIIKPNQFQHGSTHLCTSDHSPEIPIRPKFLMLEQLLLQIVTQTHVRQD